MFAVCVRHLLYHYSAALGDYSDLYVVGRDEHKVRAEKVRGLTSDFSLDDKPFTFRQHKDNLQHDSNHSTSMSSFLSVRRTA